VLGHTRRKQRGPPVHSGSACDSRERSVDRIDRGMDSSAHHGKKQQRRDLVAYLATPHHPLASSSDVRSSPSFVVYFASTNRGSLPQIFSFPPLSLNSCLCLMFHNVFRKSSWMWISAMIEANSNPFKF
jgi:hypothetical protein